MERKKIIAGAIRVALDFLSVISAWYLTYLVRPLTDLIPTVHSFFPVEALPSLDFYVPFAHLSAATLVILFVFLGFYRLNEKFDWIQECFRVLLGVFLWGMLLVSYFSLVRHETFFSRVMLFQALIFSWFLIFFLRLAVQWLLLLAWRRGNYLRRVALIGSGETFLTLQKFIPQTAPFSLFSAFNEKSADLTKILRKQEADELWYASSVFSHEKLNLVRAVAEERHLPFRFVPSETLQFARMDLDIIGGLPVLLPNLSALGGWGRLIKRFADIVISAIALLALSPLFLLIALLVKMDSPGPIFFVSERIGRFGKPFLMFKFRSMFVDAERQKKKLRKLSHRNDGPLFKIKNDPRITRVGKRLRHFSLDELPQLWNVLRGEMALTGPRPYLPEEIARFTIAERRILEIRPGLTGLSQVSGRSDLPFHKEIELNLFFIQNWSFLLEVKIILKTFWVVFTTKGAD